VLGVKGSSNIVGCGAGHTLVVSCKGVGDSLVVCQEARAGRVLQGSRACAPDLSGASQCLQSSPHALAVVVLPARMNASDDAGGVLCSSPVDFCLQSSFNQSINQCYTSGDDPFSRGVSCQRTDNITVAVLQG